MVAGCLPTPETPLAGTKILAKIPDDLKEETFFAGYPGDYYPAQVLGIDQDEKKLAFKFTDGPLVFLSFRSQAPALLSLSLASLFVHSCMCATRWW